MCTWFNMGDDDFNFIRHKGFTDSTATGPKFDHTKLTTSGSFTIFIYISYVQMFVKNSSLNSTPIWIGVFRENLSKNQSDFLKFL